MLLTIIVFFLTLLVLVITHELGHFLAAKKFGVKVLEFGFGIPPRAWGKKIGETLVSINWLPLGGFVRLLGEDETDKKILVDPDSFAAKPVGQRIVIVAAGVLMNFILAAILFWIVLAAQGFKEDIPLLTDHRFVGVEQSNETAVVLGNAAPGSPAQEAGIKNGDRVIKINDVEIKSAAELIDLTKKTAGQKVVLTLINPQNETRQVEITPRQNPPAGQGPMGVQLADFTIAHLNYATPAQKAASGITHSYNLGVYSFEILGKMIGASFATRNLEPVSQSVSGPVGLTNITGEILKTDSPFIPYLRFIALLSLSLGMFNILPIPALDGGRLVFLLIEATFRRKVRAEVEKIVHSIGFALLIALIVLITFSDIRKIFVP